MKLQFCIEEPLSQFKRRKKEQRIRISCSMKNRPRRRFYLQFYYNHHFVRMVTVEKFFFFWVHLLSFKPFSIQQILRGKTLLLLTAKTTSNNI